MAGKKGNNQAILAASLQQQENARLAAEREAQANAIAEQNARNAAAAAEADKRARIQASTDRVNVAHSAARNSGLERLKARNIDTTSDPYGIMSMFDSRLNSARAGAPEIVENANSLFAPTMLDEILSEARTTQRGNLNSKIKNDFGTDYGLRTFADTSDDAILESILGKQKTEATEGLDRALARGTLNESGRAKATAELGDMYTKGKAKANTIGGGVLADYRSQLEGGVGRVRDRASNWDFTDNFNYDTEKGSIDTLKNSLSSRLEGDILNAIGSTSFFDNDILLGKGGNATGITNPVGTTPTLTNPLVGDTNRTSGTSGTGRQVTPLDEVF